MIVYKSGDGCINSSFANERRKSILQLTIALAEYYLSNIRKTNDTKINKNIKLALSISDLKLPDGYTIVMPSNENSCREEI